MVLPLGWLILLWANGAYDRRYLGLGSEEFKRVVRTSVTVVACVSLLAFATKTQLSRGTVATVSLSALLFILLLAGCSPGRCCTCPGAAPATARTGWSWSARCPRRSRSTPRSPAARPPA